MPEGDTVHKLARVLHLGLAGKRLARLELRGGQKAFVDPPQVQAIEARGKHCLIHLGNGYALRIHLGMHGLWQRHALPYKARGEVHLILEADEEAFVCLQPREVHLLKASELARDPALLSLGPDLLSRDEPDWNAILARAALHSDPQRPLAEVLLDQRVAAGLGNVYKSELCFLGPLSVAQERRPWLPSRGTSPYTPWSLCQPDQLKGLYQRGRALLQANLGGWPRTTTDDGRRFRVASRCWVYQRHKLPCLRCHTPLQADHQGLQARATFWCPRCQPLAEWGPEYRK